MTKIKILLVEDDKSLREIYGVRLYAEGYDIVSAGDGEEALAMAIKERPGLIVSDVMMPKISGFDMLDILRSTTETKDIKVIMMTALSSEDQRARGEALGADRYLVKSQVGIEDVVRTVHDVLGDAPVASATNGAAAFATPTMSAVPRPASPTTPPPRTPAPAYPPTPAAQPAYQPQPQPVPQQPAPQPMSAPQPAAQPAYQPQPQPAPTVLPQPTAPFSTARPANLGDRVIHPISQPATSAPDLGSLIDQELNSQPAAAPQMAPAPVAPTQPMPAAFPPQPAMPPAQPQQPTPAPQPVDQPHGAVDMTFEETPLPGSTPSNPFNQGPQPPVL
jgi:CheY-like chemotaxis protein